MLCSITQRKASLPPDWQTADAYSFRPGYAGALRDYLDAHFVETTYEKGWAELSNGELLNEAEKAPFNLFLTTDQNLKYQQNLTGRKLAILVLPTTRWPVIEQHVVEIGAAVDSIRPGHYKEMSW